MALSAFAFVNAINESVSGGSYYSTSNVSAHEFVADNMPAVFAEAASGVMEMSLDMAQYNNAANGLIFEAAVTKPDKVGPMMEATWKGMVAKFKEFINKIISYVKGLVAKMSMYFDRLTGRYGAFAKTARDRMKANPPKSGSERITYNMHEWDEELVISKLAKVIGDQIDICFDGSVSSNSTDTIRAIVGQVKSNSGVEKDGKMMASAGGYSDSYAAADSGNKDAKSEQEKMLNDFNEKVSEKKEEIAKNADSAIEKLIKATAAVIGDIGGSVSPVDIDGLKKAAIRKAQKGSTDKKDVVVGGSVERFLGVIEKGKETRTNLFDKYKSYESALGKLKSEIDTMEGELKKIEINKDNKNLPSSVNGVVGELATAYCNGYRKVITTANSMVTAISNTNLSLLKQMLDEYMGAVIRVIGGKPPKEVKPS